MVENRHYYFLKLKEDFFEKREIVVLESMKDGTSYSNILVKMYLKSLQFNGFLKVNDHLSLTPEMIAMLIRQEVGTVERAIKMFLELGLAEITDTGAIYMSQIETLVGRSSTEGERKKLSRIRKERDKSMPLWIGLSGAVGQNADICPQNVRTGLDICPPEIRDKSLEIRDQNLDQRESEREKPTLPRPYGKYGNVILTEEEHRALVSEYPGEYAEMIEHLSFYMASKGRTYDNHLATMEKWKAEDRQREKQKKTDKQGYVYNGSFEEGESL